MTTTYSDLLRLALQGTGDNNNTWGVVLNSNVFEMIEDAIANSTAINITAGTGDYTLSVANGSTDESRRAVLRLTGSPSVNKTIVIPASSKVYFVHNALSVAQTITISCGTGTTVTYSQGETGIVYTDGAGVYDMLLSRMKGSNNLSEITVAATARTNLGLGTAATTAASAYATAAQGVKADTALQPIDKLTTKAYYRVSGSPHTFNVPVGIDTVRVRLAAGGGSGAAEVAGNDGTNSTCTDGTTLLTAAKGIGGIPAFSTDTSAVAHGGGTNGTLIIIGGGGAGGLGTANNSGGTIYDHGGNGSNGGLLEYTYTGLTGGVSTLTISIGAGGAAVTSGGTSGAGTDGWAEIEY